MKVIFIQGESGSGKTTYAKEIAKQHNLDYYVSSGSNDVLDSYEGQPCLILDDLRCSTIGLSDLLKMLDNHTSSSTKSRYYNKTLFCDLVIITTVQDINTFYKKVFENDDEPKEQLFRRCTMMIKLTKETMEVYSYNKDTGIYEKSSKIYENPVKNIVNIKASSFEERMEEMEDFLNLDNKRIIKIEEDPFTDLGDSVVVKEDDFND